MTAARLHAGSTLALALATCLATSTASHAQAFDRADAFSAPAETGGGGGRRFTGAPSDGLTCVVCHRTGRSRPTLTVTGMPDAFVPATRYDIVVEWPESPDNAAIALELATADGRGAGVLTLPDDATLEARDRCAGAAAAAHLAADVGDRQVVTLDSCGASRLRVQWDSPSSPAPVWLAAVLVQGNSSGDPSGDATVEHSRLISAEGFGSDVAVFGGGCSVTRGDRTSLRAWLAAAVVAALASWRRRRRRQGR